LHTGVNAGKPVPYSVHSSHLKARSTVYLEEQVGLDHVWDTVARPKPDANVTGTVPGNALGLYFYRVVAVADHKIYYISRTVDLRSYGIIPLQALCSVVDGSGSCAPQTVQIGLTVFSYIFSTSLEGGGVYSTLLQFGHTSCNSISLQFGVAENEASDVGPADVGIAQGKTVWQSAEGASNRITSMRASLDGTPWYLDVWGEYEGTGIWLNGSARCWTVDAHS
jgi:hypothetical protein